MPKNQRFEVRCDEKWRAALRRVAARMRMSETEAVRFAVEWADESEAAVVEQKESA